jgi:hypothetical protein
VGLLTFVAPRRSFCPRVALDHLADAFAISKAAAEPPQSKMCCATAAVSSFVIVDLRAARLRPRRNDRARHTVLV